MDDNTTCPVCLRRVSISRGGVIRAHGFNKSGAWGKRQGGCPGSGTKPAFPITAAALIGHASRIETEEGHLMQRSGECWYAYPKLDPDSPGSGGEVLYEGESKQLKKFSSALDAYAACAVARERYAQRTSTGLGDTANA